MERRYVKATFPTDVNVGAWAAPVRAWDLGIAYYESDAWKVAEILRDMAAMVEEGRSLEL